MWFISEYFAQWIYQIHNHPGPLLEFIRQLTGRPSCVSGEDPHGEEVVVKVLRSALQVDQTK